MHGHLAVVTTTKTVKKFKSRSLGFDYCPQIYVS